jgi:PAS domain S-box-containing protein
LDVEGNLCAVNDAWVEFLGHRRADVLETPFAEYLSGPSSGRFETVLAETETPEATIDLDVTHATGHEIPVTLRLRTALGTGDGPDAQGTTGTDDDDATDGRTDRSIHCQFVGRPDREGNTGSADPLGIDYRTYVDNSPVALFVVDDRGRYVDVNPAACTLLGYDRERLLSMSITDVTARDDVVEPSDDPVLERLHEDGRAKGEARLRTSEGAVVDVILDGVAIANDRYMAYCQDITRRREQERRLARQRDDLEVLNSITRHDIRNDLQLVVAYAELLEERLDDEEREYARQVIESANNAVELTTTARDLAETMLASESETGPTSLGAVLSDQVDRLESNYPDVTVTVDEAVADRVVVANELLDSVFRNLLSNAVQHNDSSSPEITIGMNDDADDSVRVAVADNGPGIPDEQKETVFGQGERGLESDGTGIGLYLVNTVVESYGGEVWVEDNDPRGAIFRLRLPRAA